MRRFCAVGEPLTDEEYDEVVARLAAMNAQPVPSVVHAFAEECASRDLHRIDKGPRTSVARFVVGQMKRGLDG